MLAASVRLGRPDYVLALARPAACRKVGAVLAWRVAIRSIALGDESGLDRAVSCLGDEPRPEAAAMVAALRAAGRQVDFADR
jgi:cation transport ATPase